MKLRIAGQTPESIVDGKGIRYTLYTQGCPHQCVGCHNPQSWSMDGGQEKEIAAIFLEFCENPLLKGMTFSGGEPFCQPEQLTALARLIHGRKKDITVYTGYTYEALLAMENPQIDALLAETDVLIDGKYQQEKRDLTLLFRGSENQRLIDMNATRKAGEVVLLSEQE